MKHAQLLLIPLLATTMLLTGGTIVKRGPSGGTGGGAAPVSEAYGAGWNADGGAPQKNDVYDWGHTFDVDDDGLVNTLDMATAGVVVIDGSGVIQTPTTSAAEHAELEALARQCAIEDDATPIPDACVGDGSDDAAGGAGDITAVGPGYATGAAFTDAVVSVGTSMFVWEGTTSDANELTIISPSADPGADVNITLPSSTGTLARTADLTTPPSFCFPLRDYDATGGMQTGEITTLWRPALAGTITEVWCISHQNTAIQLQIMDGSPADLLTGGGVTCTTTGALGIIDTNTDDFDNNDYINMTNVLANNEETITVCLKAAF